MDENIFLFFIRITFISTNLKFIFFSSLCLFEFFFKRKETKLGKIPKCFIFFQLSLFMRVSCFLSKKIPRKPMWELRPLHAHPKLSNSAFSLVLVTYGIYCKQPNGSDFLDANDNLFTQIEPMKIIQTPLKNLTLNRDFCRHRRWRLPLEIIP